MRGTARCNQRESIRCKLASTVLQACVFTHLLCGSASQETLRGDDSASRRETVLDREVHIEKQVLEVPQVSPLCDRMKLDTRRIDVGGCELYCETEGKGMPLVLINGGPGGTHHCFHPYFGRAAKFAKVVYYDQRGCGRSDYVKGQGYSIDQAVDDLDKLRVTLKIDRWVVLGWSYGGVLAQCYTIKHAERVAAAVLVGSGAEGLHLDLDPTRQYDFISADEQKRIGELYGKHRAIPGTQLLYNAHLNGDWKRQNFYRPTNDDLARAALYEWKHDADFRPSICRDLQRLDNAGAFQGCPIPVLILEGKYDLTWGADKAEKLHTCFPGSKLVVFERAGHGPFMDEPEKFFSVLRDFIGGLQKRHVEVAGWKAQAAARQANSMEHLLCTAGYDRETSEEIAARYSEKWLGEISAPLPLLRLGFALYDVKKYPEALAVFQKMDTARGSLGGAAAVWQGHILDLLHRRSEALVAYRKAKERTLQIRHDNYGIVLDKQYVEERLKTPFTRVENHGRKKSSPMPARMSPPTSTARKLIVGKWRIEPSHANTWEIRADGVIEITPFPNNRLPLKGVYSWTSNDTLKLVVVVNADDKREQQFVVKSIDDSMLVIAMSKDPKAATITFSRMGK
jgi:proline iminopeptidase